MPPWITGARPSGFNRTLRICSSLWRRRHIRLPRPGRPMGCRPVDGAGVADAIRLFTDLLNKHPDMTAAHFTLGNIYANEQPLSRGRG